MLCPQCQSSNRREFRTELMIHNGTLGATPDLFTFPTAWVCFDCGFSRFTFAQNELLELKEACTKAGAIECNEGSGQLTLLPVHAIRRLNRSRRTHRPGQHPVQGTDHCEAASW